MASEDLTGAGEQGQIASLQQQLAESAQKNFEAQDLIASLSADRNSPMGRMFNYLEKGGVHEAIQTPEKREVLENSHEEMVRSLFSPIITLAYDARTGFVPQSWPMQHEWGTLARIGDAVRTKAGVYEPYKQKKEGDPQNEQLEIKRRAHEIYSSRVMAETTRLRAFSTIIENGFSPMSVYFDGRLMVGIDQRRLTVMPIDALRKGFGKLKDRVLNEYEKAAEIHNELEEKRRSLSEGDPAKNQGDPEEIKKVLVEGGPKFFEEGFSDVVKKDAARMFDLANVISELNKRNAFAESGQEMRIRNENITPTEQEFIGSLFKKLPRTDEYGEEKFRQEDQTRVIRIYFDKDGKQISVNEKGEPADPSAMVSRWKDVYVNILSYENTVQSEAEHKRFMSLMMAYTMTGARERLQKIIAGNSDILNTSDLNDPLSKEFKKLYLEVNDKAKELVEDWDSPRVRQEREAAACAFELNFMLQCATVSVANLGHSYAWKMVEVDRDGEVIEKESERDRIPDNEKRFIYKYTDEIGDPDFAFDAMTAMFTLQHEYTYSAIKNRVSTPFLPPVDPKYAEKLVNYVVSGGIDPERIEYGERDPYIARFYGIVGLFANEFKNNANWKEGEAIRKRQKRPDGTQRECSQKFVQALEQTIFGVPTIYNEKVFPMPIVPFYRSGGLFDFMHISKDKTVQDVLNERNLITDIDWENYHPFANDGRAVSGRFMTDMTYIMYGATDPKKLEALFSDPSSMIRTAIKAWDIGSRNEARTFDYTYVDSEERTQTKKEPLDKKFHEITQTVYMAMAYLAFIKYNMWAGGKKWELDRNGFLMHHDQRTRDADPRITNYGDYLEAFSFQLTAKQGYEGYADAMYLLFMGLKEVVEGIAKESDVYYEEKIRPVYNLNSAGGSDPLDMGSDVGYKTK